VEKVESYLFLNDFGILRDQPYTRARSAANTPKTTRMQCLA
jgi:hypothetical protein